MKRLVPIVLCMALLLCGCGASSMKSAASLDYGMTDEEAAAPMSPKLAANGSDGIQELPQNRKLIITMGMEAETDQLDETLNRVQDGLRAVEGYVQNQNVYNGSAYSGRRYRSAELSLRIPAEKLEEFTQAVEGYINVVSSSRSTEDVTLRYVDTESRVKALKTEQERLLALLNQAQNVSELMEIESRLTEVRGDLERYSSQLKVLDNQVDYATLNLNIREVKEYTPVAEKTRLEKIGEGFVRSLRDVGSGILDFFVWLLVDLPYLIVFGLVGAAGLWVARRLWNKRKAKKQA